MNLVKEFDETPIFRPYSLKAIVSTNDRYSDGPTPKKIEF